MAAEDEPGRVLREGDVVKFDWNEDYGTRELTFHTSDDEPWTWTLDEVEPSASEGGDMAVAQCGDWETMASSLHEFVENYDFKEDGSTITVSFYAWSLQSVPYVFRDGAFVLDAPAAASVS